MEELDSNPTAVADTGAERATAGLRATLEGELESPLSAALGYADLALERASAGPERRRLQSLRRHGQKLLEVVRELVAASARGDAALPPHAEASPHQLVEAVVRAARPLAESRGLTLFSELRPGLPEHALFDSARATQALRVLLDHSLHHTPRGSVGVRASFRAPDRAHFELLDSAPGPSLAEFERIVRALDGGGELLADELSSSMLALGIAHRLARTAGGDLGFERAANGRGVYRLSLPMIPSQRANRESPRAGLHGRALFADSDPATRHWARRLLDEIGLDVTVAETGRGALDAALRGRFDLILLDVSLPGLDAFGVVSAIRRIDPGARIVALADPALAALRERARTYGCDVFLLKPLDRLTLVDLAARFVRRSANATA